MLGSTPPLSLICHIVRSHSSPDLSGAPTLKAWLVPPLLCGPPPVLPLVVHEGPPGETSHNVWSITQNATLWCSSAFFLQFPCLLGHLKEHMNTLSIYVNICFIWEYYYEQSVAYLIGTQHNAQPNQNSKLPYCDIWIYICNEYGLIGNLQIAAISLQNWISDVCAENSCSFDIN